MKKIDELSTMCAATAEERFGPKASVPELIDTSTEKLAAKVDRLERMLKALLSEASGTRAEAVNVRVEG